VGVSRSELIAAGYDAIAERYLAARSRTSTLGWVERAVAGLAPGARVLDLGCGAGVPVAAWLVARGYEVTGIDLSARQLALAREQVPGATLIQADLAELRPGALRADAIVALYSVFHVPRERHGSLYRVLASYLPAGGRLLVLGGAGELEGTGDFHGAPMTWSQHAPEANRALLEAAGFAIELDEIDPADGERHQVLLGVRAG